MSAPTTPDQRLDALGIALPQAPAAVANYVPAVQINGLLAISGQVPFQPGAAPPRVAYTGRLGADVDLETGIAAARLCAIHVIAQIRHALGTLERVERIVKLGVFIAAEPGFGDHPKVANGASDLMVQVFGEAGRHSRFAVGASSLPLNVPVEVDALVAVRPA